jgi:FMN phosphatase YigB (HAD superfamily)
MIRVVMFDLGGTLVDNDRHPFPHITDALTAMAAFKTADGKPLRSCLVSDYTMPEPPATQAKITALFKKYLAILDQTGLRAFFEPVEKRVTLSTHAGVAKPDRRIFETALQRLGAKVPLEECLFITEDAGHIKEAREKLKMQTLQFGSAGAGGFEDWADAPALIANLVAPGQAANSHAAIKAHLAAKGVDLVHAEPAGSDRMTVSGQVWLPISVPGLEDLQHVYVAIPVQGEVTRGPKGERAGAADIAGDARQN